MNYFLLPSLQQAATVRTAALLYNDCEMERMLKKDASISLRQRWQPIEREMAEKLSSVLPPPLQNAVAKVLRPMLGEVEEWKSNHEYLLKHLGGCCSAWLCWKTDGTIDRTETAKKLVANESIDPEIRFVLACTYFLEEEVLALWERINVRRKRKSRLVLEHTNEAVEIWRKWFAKKESKHWTEMVDEYFRMDRRAGGPTGREVPARISCYYPFLSKELRLKFIKFFVRPSAHSDDFPLCVNNMDEAERIEAFKFHYPIGLAVCFRWPYRSLFIKMAREVFNYLPAGAFTMMLYVMLRTFIDEADDDFHLFEEFWLMSPLAFKDEAKRTKFFMSWAESFLKMEECPKALKEILRRCCFD